MTIEINEANFESVTAMGAVVVDFWAAWCGPCRMQGPIFEDVSALYDGKCVFAKMDIDKNQATAKAFGIMSIPTLAVFKDGKLTAKNVGMLSKSQLINFVDKNI